MKRLAIAVLAMAFAMPLFAAVPAKTELSLSGVLVNPKDAPNTWTLNTDLLFPVNKAGSLLIGPSVALADDADLTHLGAGLEWNIHGQKHGGFFIGSTAYWYSDEQPDGQQYSLIGKAGFKINVGKGAAIKLSLEEVLDGAYSDSNELSVGAGIIAKF